MLKNIYRNKLYQMINELTLDDFLFDVGTTTGLIDPKQVRLVSSVKKINGDVVYKVKMPYIDSCFSNGRGYLENLFLTK